MRYYQVDVHFLPEINPDAAASLEQLGMKLTEERHGLVRGSVGARNEAHALDIAREALARIEDGDVQIIKPSPEPGHERGRVRETQPHRPVSEAYGLIDFTVDQAENRWWYVHETRHHKPSPGDDSPEDAGIVGYEHRTRGEAERAAIRLAKSAVAQGHARQSAVFSRGEEVFFLDRDHPKGRRH